VTDVSFIDGSTSVLPLGGKVAITLGALESLCVQDIKPTTTASTMEK